MADNDFAKPKEQRQELSLELNFRSFMAGEGAPFFQPVPLEEMLSFAEVGSPVTIPDSGPYTPDELRQIAAAVRKGGSAMTLKASEKYPADLLAELERESAGRLQRG